MHETSYEDRLPKWQRWLNESAENWLFAFIVVVAFKHFAFELYVIPSASMEPTLYGDASFTKGDKVIAAKFPAWLSDPERWDVTVFEYPKPEIMVNGAPQLSEINGQRRDHVFTQPLVHRNFVKRLTGLPGETYYIDQGDIFIQQSDGSFAIPQKPADVQEILWTPVYQHRYERKTPYKRAWLSLSQQASVQEDQNGSLVFRAQKDGRVRFNQPLNNLYIKAGKYWCCSVTWWGIFHG